MGDSRNAKILNFGKEESSPPSPKGLEKILFQQSDAKMQSSDDTPWNSPLFNVDDGSLPSPATATRDQHQALEGAVVMAEKKKRRETQLNPTCWYTKSRW
eukprot:jgi/Psemu1/23589/gm1.23589_g